MKLYDKKIQLFSSFILSLWSVMGFSQTILYQAENTSRTVQDPQTVVLAPGFQAKASISNPFVAKIGPATENPGGGPADSNAGATNPSGTKEDSIKFHDTKGNIEVNGSGQLQFTLPIALPPGVKSVAPQINLVYTSGAGNGIAGYGWTLTGITSISRTGKTIEKDGQVKGVQLDYSDYYSFNGQRLILKSGEYGKDGAEYVTEKYSNIKIKSAGNNPEQNGPLYFEVTFEDGSQAWYGIDTGRTLTEYNITKWKDTQGNYLTYEYDKQYFGGGCTIDIMTGQLDCTIATDANTSLLKKISWGGNEILGKPHFNNIEFNHIDRAFREQSYLQGQYFVQNKLLSGVNVNVNGNQFKRYGIDYSKDASNYQFIDKITEYNSKDEAANPIVFKNEVDPEVTNIFQQNDRYDEIFGDNIISGDFNGDGKVDFVRGNTIMLGRLDGTGNFVNINFAGEIVGAVNIPKENKITSRQAIVTSEIDYQNKKVQFRTYALEENNTLSLISTNELDVSSYPNLVTSAPYEYSTSNCSINKLEYFQKVKEGDFNGDGISEILYSLNQTTTSKCSGNTDTKTKNEYFYIDLKTGLNRNITSLFTTFTDYDDNGKLIIVNSYDRIVIADVDNDGKSDLYIPDENKISVYTLSNNAFNKLFDSNLESLNRLYFGDFNGDGKTDIIAPIAKGSREWRLYISTGKGFIKHYYSNLYLYEPSWQGAPRKNRNITRTYSTSDLNKDGKSDFIVFESQVFARSEANWNDWSSSYGFEYFKNDAIDNHGKPIFTRAYTILPKEIDCKECEDLNFSGYGEHYIPLFGSFRLSQINTEFAIIHKTKLITWDLGNKLNVVSRIKSITQAGIKTDIEYSKLVNDGIIYKSLYSTNPVTYPFVNIIENLNYYVVSKLTQLGRKQIFRYRDLIGNLHGKGMIGFRQTARSVFFTEWLMNDKKIWNGSEIDPINEGLPSKEWSIRTSYESEAFPSDISLNNNQLLSFKQYSYKIDKLLNGTVVTNVSNVDKNKVVTAINPTITISKDFLKNIKTVHSVEEYDNLYLPKKSVTNINDGFSILTSKLEYYPPNTTPGNNYSIGKPSVKTDIIQAYGDIKSAKEEYTYDSNLLKSLKIWNRENTEYVLESYNHDGFGNITKKTISNSTDSQEQKTESKYDNLGRFVVEKTDNLGLKTNIIYNDWGLVEKQTDALGNVLNNEYDSWGKLVKSKTNLTGITSYEYIKDKEYNSTVIQYDPDGNISKKYTNKWGQDYKTSTKSFGQGKYISKQTQYDGIGRKLNESEPYFEGQNPTQWNTIYYNDIFFPAKVTSKAFNGKQTETFISGNTITEKELNGYERTTSKTTDALGNIISSIDMGGTINFFYNAAGEQIKAQYAENAVTTKYDSWGRKSEFNDPSNGTYQYEYDGFGQLKKTISPKGTKEYTYNNLGQLISQKEISATDGGQATNKLISFAYDDKGRIISKFGTSKGKAYSSKVSYDPQGRLLSSSESSNGKYFIQKGIIYDDKARVTSYEKQLYSSGVLTKVQIENVYSAWSGELYQVKDKLSGKILWELKETNAKGQVLKSKLGAADINNIYDDNGFLTNVNHSSQVKPGILQLSYSFDAIKNELKSRTTGGDFNINESFDYDNNNRLVNWTNPVTGIKPTTNRNVYDIKGRITQNDQVGTIKFENPAKIYQPTGMTLNAAGEQNYNNDLIQTITYNENNDPVFIDGMKGDAAFQYGLTSMRQRVTYGDNFSIDGDGKFTKFYSEDGSFEVVKDNTTGKEKHLVYIGGNPYESNIVYLKNFTENTGSYKFLHKDYIGSILAISDETGNKLEQRHFDAWGSFTHLQIGNGAIISDQNIILNLSKDLVIDRGYTSHEHFAEIGIIHMNGRLYDPLLRRFLNADEFIQDPYNTQNYNKYSYVMNNPLMFNDPTGEIMGWDDALIAIGIAIFTSTATDYYLNRPINIGNMFQSVVMSLTSAGISSAIGDVFLAGTKVAESLEKAGTIIAKAGAHAIAQGTLSYMQGGNFWSGALSGTFASASNDLLDLAVKHVGENNILRSDGFALFNGAVSGGVGSVLGGGNFWMGAGQGLMVTAFNFLAHKETTVVEDSDDGDCPTCPKNAKQWQTHTTNNYNAFDEEFWTWEKSPIINGSKTYFYSYGKWHEIKYITGDVPIGPAGAGKGLKILLSKESIKSIKSFKNLIIEHQSKLTKYILNPDKYDNVGILKKAPNEIVRNKIIQSRIKHLQHEIKTFHKNINNILNGK
ncbi:RHS repeat-associated core domain-containing protein [Chryseobacterium indologenes]|uniref:RHS repeat-associated core domain-containing protein n=1 Tax=Chryseobacterium indologenes TaxID=253 RepID=UPI00201734FA|nr:RHS repeat-associated core domain-containing protein [Chryseobacterium indologenes]